MAEPRSEVQSRPQDVQALIREATLILKEPLEAMAGPLRTYRKRLQVGLEKCPEQVGGGVKALLTCEQVNVTGTTSQRDTVLYDILCLLSSPQFLMRKIREVDLEALAPSPECPADQLQRLRLAVPEVGTICVHKQHHFTTTASTC